jgi:hypothetical protein
MADSGVFKALVLELSPDERVALLERLHHSTSLSQEPLQVARPEDAVQIDYMEMFLSLPFFTRLFIIIKSLFSGVSKEDLVRNRCLRMLARKLESAIPGLVDIRRGVLLEPFQTELLALRLAARYFYDLLDRTLEKNRGAFFAFLGSLEFEQVHTDIVAAVDPEIHAMNNPLASEIDIRNASNSAFEAALTGIPENLRRAMTADVRNLYGIKKLSSLLFDRFLGAFREGPNGKRELSLYAAVEYLLDLHSALLAVTQPPSMKLMEALLAFNFNDELEKDGFDLEEAIKKEMSQVERFLTVIRGFNTMIPMIQLVRLAHEDPNLACEAAPVGEDWFPIYKAYWRDRLDRNMQRFMAERRIRQLEADIDSVVGVDYKSALSNLSETGSDLLVPVRLARVLRFLEAFYNRTFLHEINRPLKLILLEGEFYKRDNRLEFTDAYNTLLQVNEGLRGLDYRLSPQGELGTAFIHARKELVSIQIRKRKLDSAIHTAENEAEALIRKTVEALSKMQLILNGILAGEARSRYDSLSNLSRIEGKGNKEFIRALGTSKDKLEKSVYLISELTKAAMSIGERV